MSGHAFPQRPGWSRAQVAATLPAGFSSGEEKQASLLADGVQKQARSGRNTENGEEPSHQGK